MPRKRALGAVESLVFGLSIAALLYGLTPWLVGLLWLADKSLRWAIERPIHLFWIMTPFTILILAMAAWDWLRAKKEHTVPV